MKNPSAVILSVVTLVLAGSRCVLADPLLTSVIVTSQSPNPVCPGGTANFLVTMTKIEKGNLEVYLSAAGLPPGATATFSPNPVRFTSDSKTSVTASLQMNTTTGTPPGQNPFTIVAAAGGAHNTRTNTGTLNLTLCSAGAVLMANGGICLAFDGIAGQNYRVEATTSLTTPVVWTTLCTTNLGNQTLLVLTDMDSTNYPARFYRMVPQ